MTNRKLIASVLIFAGSTLCFFLPFVTVSCGGMKAFTLNGQQLATGTTLTHPQPFGPPQEQKIDADPFAAVAWLCAIAGIALSLAGRKLAAATAVSGGVGAVSLFIMRTRLDEQLQKQGQGMATASYESGFILAILLLLAGAAWNIYLFLENKQIRERAPAASGASSNPITAHGLAGGASRVTSGHSSSTRVCSGCGQAMQADVRFCESCGKPAKTA